jgi:putative flippase GtrA
MRAARARVLSPMNRESGMQALRFVAVGGSVMVLFMFLNWLFDHWVGTDSAFLLAYGPALAAHFVLNKYWTFGCERRDTGRQLGEYLAMVAITFLVQLGVFKAVTAFSTVPGWLAAGIANAVQTAITYAFMRWWVFASDPRGSAR